VACATLSIELPAAFPRRLQDRLNVSETLARLFLDRLADDVSRRRIERTLARDEDEAVGLHGLAVPGETFRGVVGADDLLRHGVRHYRAPTLARSLRLRPEAQAGLAPDELVRGVGGTLVPSYCARGDLTGFRAPHAGPRMAWCFGGVGSCSRNLLLRE